MIRNIMNQCAALMAVVLIVFFCTSGMTRHDRSDSPDIMEVPTSTTPTENTDAPMDTAPPTVPDTPQETEDANAPIELTAAPEGYFEDALFIGDSRTVGLMEYGPIPGAAYFATVGMSVYSIFHEEVAGASFEDLMESRSFGKIYVMLGINELGCDFERTVKEYGSLIEWIRQRQPEAVIYIEANLHVSADRSGRDEIYNNQKLDAFNERISRLADGVQIFYLDVNPLFDDGSGNLADEFTVDDTHVLGKYYRTWSDWIMENAAVIPT